MSSPVRALALLTTTALTGGLLMATTASPAAAAPGGALLYGLTTDNQLVSFRAETPGSLVANRAITGLAAGEDLVGIDIRPATGALYALSRSGRLYVVDPDTAVATAGAQVATTLLGDTFGIDVNPVVDRLRVVSNTDQNLRVDLDTGAATSDGQLRYPATDAGANTDPGVAAAAYVNSVAGATSTVLYDLDTVRDTLVTQAPPNDGLLNTVGPLGFDFYDTAGLDVDAADGTAYAVLRTVSGTALYRIALGTGTATAAGAVQANIEDVAVGTPRLLVLPASVDEGGSAVVTVRRTGDLTDALTVDYVTTAGTATEADFTRVAGTLSFAAGAREATITVTTVRDDLREGNEAFSITLSNPTAGAVASAGTVTVRDASTATPAPTPSTTPDPGPVLGACGVPAIARVSPATILAGSSAGVGVQAAANSIVDLQAYSRPSTSFRVVRSAPVSANGTVTFTVTPGTNTRLRAVQRGCSAGPSVVLSVRSQLSLAAARIGLRRYTVAGSTLPRRPGQIVRVYTVGGSGQQTLVASTRTGTGGRYAVQLRFARSGSTRLVARTGSDLTNAGGTSAVRAFRVR